ncbi:MAG: sigma factor-like helix-turn-helix DNA-binding protein, partial [Myxococcaceae bacterium]
KQRAVLLLRDVLGSSAQECAALLETSVASVNSALQRARAALEQVRPPPVKIESEAQRDLLARYVRAWENAEVDALLALLADDATLAMPPLRAWYHGHEDIERQLRSMAMPPESKGTRRFQLTSANGLPAVAVWKRDSATQLFQAEAIQVLEISPDDRVRAITAFMDTRIFPSFGLATEMKGP